jgi:hypothetical protein
MDAFYMHHPSLNRVHSVTPLLRFAQSSFASLVLAKEISSL